MENVELEINGKHVVAVEGMTIIQAARQAKPTGRHKVLQ